MVDGSILGRVVVLISLRSLPGTHVSSKFCNATIWHDRDNQQITHHALLNSRFHEGGFQFKARFDRCYTKGDALKLNQFDLVGNLPVRKDDGGSGAGDYLSDHFGMLVRIDVDGRVAEE